MPINFDTALGIHEKALILRNRRTEVIANNIVNADTPGYKARDLDFQKVLSQQTTGAESKKLFGSNEAHFSAMTPSSEVTLSYRVPTQPSLDGNTVDEQQENATFARNAIEHQASFQILNGKFTSLIKAIRGE